SLTMIPFWSRMFPEPWIVVPAGFRMSAPRNGFATGSLFGSFSSVIVPKFESVVAVTSRLPVGVTRIWSAASTETDWTVICESTVRDEATGFPPSIAASYESVALFCGTPAVHWFESFQLPAPPVQVLATVAAEAADAVTSNKAATNARRLVVVGMSRSLPRENRLRERTVRETLVLRVSQ